MFNLRSLMPKDARQTLALCIVWGALAACSGLCLLAPAKHPVDIGPGEPRLSAVMISLAATGL